MRLNRVRLQTWPQRTRYSTAQSAACRCAAAHALAVHGSEGVSVEFPHPSPQPSQPGWAADGPDTSHAPSSPVSLPVDKVNHAKQFVKALRVPYSPAALHQLVLAHQQHLDRQAVTALASHVADAAISQAGGADALQWLATARRLWLPLFQRRLRTMDATGLCICVQSAAKLSAAVAQELERSAPQRDQGPQQGQQQGGQQGQPQGPQGQKQVYHSTGRPLFSDRLLSSQMPFHPLYRLIDEATVVEILHAAAAQLPRFQPRSTVQLLWGLTSLDYRLPPSWLERFLGTALSRSFVRHASPQDLALLLWCLGKQQYIPTRGLLQRVLEEAEGKLQAMDAQQLGMCMWSLAVLRCSPSEAFAQAVEQRAIDLMACSSRPEAGHSGDPHWQQGQGQQQQQQQEGGQDGGVAADGSARHAWISADAAWGIAQGQQPPGRQWEEEPCRQQGCPGPPSCYCSAAAQQPQQLRQHQQHQRQRRRGSRTDSGALREPQQHGLVLPAAIAQLVYGFFALGITPSPGFCHATAAAVLIPADLPGPEGCSQSLHAHFVHGMGLRECMLLVMGFARWRHAPSAAWLSALYATMQPQLPSSKPDALVGLLWALAQLPARPPPEWMAAAETRLLSAAERLSPTAAARCLLALGRLRYAPAPPLGAALLAQLCRSLRVVPAKHLFPAMLAAAQLGLPASRQQLQMLVLGPVLAGKYSYCQLHNLVQHAAAVGAWGVLPGGRWSGALLEAVQRWLPAPATPVGQLVLLACCLARVLGQGTGAAVKSGGALSSGAALQSWEALHSGETLESGAASHNRTVLATAASLGQVLASAVPQRTVSQAQRQWPQGSGAGFSRSGGADGPDPERSLVQRPRRRLELPGCDALLLECASRLGQMTDEQRRAFLAAAVALGWSEARVHAAAAAAAAFAAKTNTPAGVGGTGIAAVAVAAVNTLDPTASSTYSSDGSEEGPSSAAILGNVAHVHKAASQVLGCPVSVEDHSLPAATLASSEP